MSYSDQQQICKKMREEFFDQKDYIMEIAIKISNAIKDYFSEQEKKKSDSLVVFQSFNDQQKKL